MTAEGTRTQLKKTSIWLNFDSFSTFLGPITLFSITVFFSSCVLCVHFAYNKPIFDEKSFFGSKGGFASLCGVVRSSRHLFIFVSTMYLSFVSIENKKPFFKYFEILPPLT